MRNSFTSSSPIDFVQGEIQKRSFSLFCRELTLLLAAIALVLGSWTSGRAQVAGSGNLTGTVTDQKGAAVGGAKVAVRNSGTGLSRDLVTDNAGEFRALQVPPGVYDVTVQASGFATIKMTGIRVDVGATETVPITLKVAAVSEEVTVSGQAPLLETEKTEVSETLSHNLVSNLPINGRRWENFVLLTPSVTTDGTFGLVSYRGISGLYNNNTVDGADNNQAFFSESRGRTRIAYQYSQESISEFQVTTSNYSAEFGRSAGGIVNAVTKSGTNAYHGDLFEYIRQFHGNAYDPLAKYNNLINGSTLFKPELLRNQFGGDFGGPIYKNKLFFYADNDGQRRSLTGLITPSSASYFNTDSTGVANQNNCMLAAGHPTAAQCAAAISYLQSLTGGYKKGGNQDVGFGKIDWQANSKNRISGSLNWHRWDGPNNYSGATPSDNGNDVVRDRFVVVDWTSTPSSSKVNDLRFQYGQDFEADTPNASGPSVFITGLTTYGMPNSLPRPYYPDERRWQLTEGLSIIKGKHTFKVGADLNFIHEISANLFQGGGIYSYTGSPIPAFQNWINDVFQLNTGATTGKHYVGQQFVQSFDPVTGIGRDDFWNTNVGAYIQDTWKLRSNLTVNYGLRWDVQYVPGPFKPNTTTPLTTLYTSTLNIDKNNFGPRLGISWSPDQKTVVRAGYGLYYAQTSNSTFYALRNENGAVQQTFQCFYNSACATEFPNVVFTPPGPPLAAPFPGAATPAVTNTNPPLGAQLTDALSPNFVNPLVHMGELGVERELPGRFSISASYLFSRGQRLPVFIDTNLLPTTTTQTYDITDSHGNTLSTVTVPFYTARANPTTGVILTGFSALNSWYNALVVTVQKHYGHGLEMLANFTWSHAQDNGEVPAGSGTFTGTDTPLDPANLKQEYANSDLDQRKRFVGSFVYTPPFFHNSSAFVRKAFDGFAFSGILSVGDGHPLTPFISGGVGSGPGACSIDGGVTCGEVSSFGGATGGRVPFLGRNSVTMPGIQTFDMRVARNIPLGEQRKLMVAVEAFNLTNTDNIYGEFNSAYALTAATASPTTSCKIAQHANPCLVQRTDFLNPSATSGFNGNVGARQLQATVRFSF